MANKQRGKRPSSCKTVDMEKQTEHFSLVLASSDDEAPEEVTFEDSKAEALRSTRKAMVTATREKNLLKERRRKRQELFQEQKNRKLLPAEVLQEIDSAPSKKHKLSEAEAEEEQQEAEEHQQKDDKLAHTRNLKGTYTVTTAKEREASSFQLQAAQDFLQSRLYGPGSCRTTSNELLSLQNKKGRIKSAAVQFVKKDWACDAKAKAEKLKKRWIHKQQVPSS